MYNNYMKYLFGIEEEAVVVSVARHGKACGACMM